MFLPYLESSKDSADAPPIKFLTYRSANEVAASIFLEMLLDELNVRQQVFLSGLLEKFLLFVRVLFQKNGTHFGEQVLDAVGEHVDLGLFPVVFTGQAVFLSQKPADGTRLSQHLAVHLQHRYLTERVVWGQKKTFLSSENQERRTRDTKCFLLALMAANSPNSKR